MWCIISNNMEEFTMRKELLKGLSEEQIKKVESCERSEEILALAKAEGIELSDDQLEAVTGGACAGDSTCRCSECGSKNIKHKVKHLPNNAEVHIWSCQDCGNAW